VGAITAALALPCSKGRAKPRPLGIRMDLRRHLANDCPQDFEVAGLRERYASLATMFLSNEG